jgi:hypothetical protein
VPPSPPAVFIQWERFLGWLLPRTEKLPKRVAFTFRTRIDNLALDVFELLVEARYERERTPMLRRINLDLEKLRLLLRLVHDQHMLDGKAFAHACGELDATGRMIGGWLRQQAERGP